MYGVREHSNFILIFIAKEPARCLHSGCSQFPFQHQCRRVPFALNPLQHILLVEAPSVAILTDVRSYLLEVLICISLIFSNGDIFTCDFFKTVKLTHSNYLLERLPCF